MKCPYCSETITTIKVQYLNFKRSEKIFELRDKQGATFAKLCPLCDKILDLR